MSVVVQIKHVPTGEISERFSVDAADLLATGEYVQVAGMPVKAAIVAPPEKPPGPPVVKTEGKPSMTHKGAGKYVVSDASGKVITEKPVSKADAEAILATLE